MAEAILKVEGLKKYFETSKGMLHAVDDLDFEINKGETMGLVGESAVGNHNREIDSKTIEATDGKVVLMNKMVTNMTKRELSKLRRDVQIIFQDPFSSLNPSYPSRNNCRTFNCSQYGKKKNSELEKRF